ncbi:hypothetical protein VFPPC_17719 [Pochonia chlamydosporia 170]|uniref:Secreted protein n=1 Tax=Pochonia chlamydosporia 170 TaxID=1380566 RepID=A0A219ASB6_METCM|nr:hypothetical protein VFPPC_17719 [Pochonia chlamydosporia 170]OWT43105.1 hypothetical protein VFPPC_17719 [Pochonia chlamydosporia 170]
MGFTFWLLIFIASGHLSLTQSTYRMHVAPSLAPSMNSRSDGMTNALDAWYLNAPYHDGTFLTTDHHSGSSRIRVDLFVTTSKSFIPSSSPLSTLRPSFPSPI